MGASSCGSGTDEIEFSIVANDNSINCTYNHGASSAASNIAGTAITDAVWAATCVPLMTAKSFGYWIDRDATKGATVGYSVNIRTRAASAGAISKSPLWDDTGSTLTMKRTAVLETAYAPLY